MKLALQIASWLAVGLGLLTAVSSSNAADPNAAILGGLMFGGLGILALVYVHKQDKKEKEKKHEKVTRRYTIKPRI